MLIKEFIQIFRDPRMKSILFVTPVVQLLIFGYAASYDVRNVATAVVDLDSTSTSRAFSDSFVSSDYFEMTKHVATYEEAQALIDRSDVEAVLYIRHGFGADVASGRPAEVQMLVDASDSNTAGIILSYASTITGRFNMQLAREQVSDTAVRQPFVKLEPRAWYNENLESRPFFLPGVMAIIVSLVALLLTSMAVVREKEMGTIEQIIVTPIKPIEFILGKTIPFALISFIDVVIVVLVGVFWFGIPIRGNPLVLLLGVSVYLLSTLAIGLFISTISSTQQQALMTTFLFFLPAILLSGFVFPIANMPEVIQWLTYLNPLRFFLVIIRGVFLKGVGLSILWPQLLALLLLGVSWLSLASVKFRKTLG